MDRPQQLSLQLKGMERLVDADSGATLLCLDIRDPAGMARLLADPVKSQLPVGDLSRSVSTQARPISRCWSPTASCSSCTPAPGFPRRKPVCVSTTPSWPPAGRCPSGPEWVGGWVGPCGCPGAGTPVAVPFRPANVPLSAGRSAICPTTIWLKAISLIDAGHPAAV